MEFMDFDKIDEILFYENYGKPIKSDYAIVCGTAPEYAFIRAEIAASFYKKSGTEKIIVSGAAVSDKSVTECAFLKNELIALGVPAEAIIEEPRAYDTIQNMTCSLTEICKRTDIMQVESIAVITEPFHIKRAVCLAKILLPQFIKVYGYTEGVAEQRGQWKTDERLNNCVKNEIIILKDLAAKGRIKEVEL
ncbi:MAG: YdcF family protein [Clostridia bacterium]|nr:YdcF family protein [Clostridia bacterium]